MKEYQLNKLITITMTREQLCTIGSALDLAAEYIEPDVDIKDGDEGDQLPNDAMVAMRDIDEALVIVNSLLDKSKP